MKRISSSLVLIFFFNYLLTAQATKELNIFIQGGLTGGGYNLGAGVEKTLGANNDKSITLDFNFHDVTNNTVKAVGISSNVYRYFLSANFKKYFDFSSLYPYVGVGLLGGYQCQKGDSSGIYSVEKEQNFLAGAKAFSGIEYRFDKIALFLDGTYLYTGEHLFTVNIGLKYRF